ncbi:MAG: FMN-binding negative transcriptional regulator [Labilithrix sp.]|nr:FMN-binding negative transcriptional regulator [Labilithrix sp.]MCW5812484.1 FMN-binding negative transcriptional regulator [Labilithrix sp.]
MYVPKHNAETDLRVIQELAARRSFATLLAPRADGQIEIAHLPFLVDAERDRLRVHVARANRIWRDVTDPGRRGDVVVVFAGPHGYVSPTWYESPKDDVPTWNYAVAHAHVTTPSPMTREELIAFLDELSAQNETGHARWRFDEHPAESREELLAAIVGLTLPVARWEAKWKLSQNRAPADHANVVAAFERRATPDDLEMVELMRRR